ncbi:hypothetical protein Nepgr_020099 [Nepenthes gracilis]|uniref:Importin N-terminal domain-containing protein n=1 Tax=Nepenthes gracilis TaxID=150966 RepID=A0AAD3SUG7_NEPGR|nr:hypothetical protein Nepgr_020099 [Nepenthes gracilis]
MMAGEDITQILNETLSPDADVVRNATGLLDRLSLSPDFPFSLLSITVGDKNEGVRIAAATYLKNLIRRNFYEGRSTSASQEFKNQLLHALLRLDTPVLKVLLEAFRIIVDAEFVKQNAWPEVVPELQYAIQRSNVISGDANSEWRTVNALTLLQAMVRNFQYFLNPKIAREPVPPQLEQIADKILVPLLAVFHSVVEKALAVDGNVDIEIERTLLIVCKCMYYAVRSYMPSSLAPLLPSFCGGLYAILGSLNFERDISSVDSWLVRLKTGKRILLIFCALVTRHRKYSDKLMPDVIKCSLNIVRFSALSSNLDYLSERIVSLAFDVISHVLETGPGWRLVSPYFSSLLESAIFPALAMNEKDISEWANDEEEFVRKNFPSDLGETSGWRDDLFTARKSAINLLGVISMSKGPPVVTSSQSSSISSKRKKGEKNKGKNQFSSMGELLVVPFLSKFPIPLEANASASSMLNNYFGVLLGYGSLQDFLREQKPEYTGTLILDRVLPLYKVPSVLPQLVAVSNWVLKELVSCLPEDMSADIYSSLLKALTMPDCGDLSCYPVRATAAGAIAGLLENDYLPPNWLPLLEVLVGKIGNEDQETSMLFQLLSSVVEAGNEEVAVHAPLVVPSLVDAISKCLTSNPETSAEVVGSGFAALAVIAKSWEDSVPEEAEENELSAKWAPCSLTIASALSSLLQQVWLIPTQTMDDEGLSRHMGIDDASTLLWFIMRSVTSHDDVQKLKVPDLLLVWADLIADWNAWEELEDLPIFDCIKEVVGLQKKFGLRNFFAGRMPSPPAPPVPKQSIIEAIGSFISEAISQYPSAARRACLCVHIILHLPTYSFGAEDVKHSLVSTFSLAAMSRFKEIESKSSYLEKPLLLSIASCYLCYPSIVETVLEKDEKGGFVIWASALSSLSSKAFSGDLSAESEIKLIAMTLAKVVEQLMDKGIPFTEWSQECFISLVEACKRLKEVQREEEEAESDEEADDADEDSETDDYDDEEDSEEDVHEETEEEFLERYAKTAAALENGTIVEEGDAEEDDEEPELGCLEEFDQQKLLESLLEKYQVLIQRQLLSPQLMTSILNSFPEYERFFRQ